MTRIFTLGSLFLLGGALIALVGIGISTYGVYVFAGVHGASIIATTLTFFGVGLAFIGYLGVRKGLQRLQSSNTLASLVSKLNMLHPYIRDLSLAMLFGIIAAPLLAVTIGIGTFLQMPLLDALAHAISRDQMTWVIPAYMFVWGVIYGAVCALMIALPLGYGLCNKDLAMWLLFVSIFLCTVALSHFLSLSSPEPWAFLGWSAVFVRVARRKQA